MPKKKLVKMIIVVNGLTPTGAVALESFLAMAQKLGDQGSSRWLSLYADGDGDFRPKVSVCVENAEDGTGDEAMRDAKVSRLVQSGKRWTKDKREWRLDPQVITEAPQNV